MSRKILTYIYSSFIQSSIIALIMLARALDILFPPQCLGCDALVPTHGTLCLPCWNQIKFISAPMCAACGLPFEFAIDEGALCGKCLEERPPFSRARSAFVYDDHSRALVLKLKYSDQLHLAAVYDTWLAKAGADLIAASDVIVPVPLHWRRFISRRYNQASLLGQSLSKKVGLPVIEHALLRKRHTPQQTGLSRKQRQDNVQGAFTVNPKYKAALKGKSVLLIDDVLTTGATLSTCAEALLKSGASNVNVLTLARTAG